VLRVIAILFNETMWWWTA